MSRVLVVDDEPRYREHISRMLMRHGYDVRTAGDARQAITDGSRFRPDVLIADWMLKCEMHGLHVSEALRAVVPDLKTILITGFPSMDLREDARSIRVSEFIEKPFELSRLHDAVRAAESATSGPLDHSPIAIVEVDPHLAVRFANERARQLFATSTVGHALTSLADVLAPGAAADWFEEACRRWTELPARTDPPTKWHIRCKPGDEGRTSLVIIVPDAQRHHQYHPVVRMLLDLDAGCQERWPFAGRTLIVDDDQWVRHVVATQIEHSGGICHTANTLEAALETCRRDSGIELIVLDHDLPGEVIADRVAEFRALLPDARIIGTSGFDREDQFRSMGIDGFLAKPWTITDLVDLVLDRIGKCSFCELPLPLRRPRGSEAVQSWVCANCGCRYRAVLDIDNAPEIQRNVRLAQPSPL